MAVYVTSNLHGLAPGTLKRLLDKAGFSDADWLLILGHAIDRHHAASTFPPCQAEGKMVR